MKKLLALLGLISAIAFAWNGSGWTPGPSTGGAGYDPDSLWWYNGYGDSTWVDYTWADSLLFVGSGGWFAADSASFIQGEGWGIDFYPSRADFWVPTWMFGHAYETAGASEYNWLYTAGDHELDHYIRNMIVQSDDSMAVMSLEAASTAFDSVWNTGQTFFVSNVGDSAVIVDCDGSDLFLNGAGADTLGTLDWGIYFAVTDSSWYVAHGGSGGGWSGDSLDLRVLSVSDSAFIDTLQVNIVNGSSPVTFLDDINAPSINSMSGWMTALDFKNSEGYWEFLAGPDSLSWGIQEIDADKTDRTWDSHIGDDGTIYLLSWRDSDDNLIFWERSAGTGEWSSVQIDVAATIYIARMAVSEDGDVYIVWNDGSASLRRRISGSWQVAQAIGVGEYVNSLAVDYCDVTNTLGIVYACRVGSDISDYIQESVDYGANFGAIDTIKALGYFSSYSISNHQMDIAYDESGIPWVVCQPEAGLINYSYRTAPSTWSAYARIDGFNGTARPPRLEAYGDSLLIASSNNTYLRLSVNEAGAGWSSTQIKATDISYNDIGGLAVNSAGKVAIIAGDGTNDLYLIENTTGSWTETQLAASEAPTGAGIRYNPVADTWGVFYAKSTLNYSYLLNTSGQGQNTGFADVVARINSRSSGDLTGFMIDPGGYGNADLVGGTLFIGNPVGNNDTLRVCGETSFQNRIMFSTPVAADTIKDLASEPITDSLVFTDSYANGFASLGQFSTPAWVTTLGAWIKVPSDSTYLYWQCQLSPDTDSLAPLSPETYLTDTVLVNSANWTYYEWTFQSPFVIPYMFATLKFECDKPADAVQVRLGAVQADSVTPTFYGIENYVTTLAKIPNIRLFSTNTISQETIQAVYDANLCGMRFSSLSARAADFLTVNTSTIQSLGDGSGIYVGGPIDFQRSILVNGTSTVTDTCFTSSGDMFVFVNGLLTEFVSTP